MDASDFLTADFQRVNISGEDSSGVPVEDLHSAAELLTRALNIREKYMRVSHQEFPANVERYNLLRIQLKLNTALLSTVRPSVRPCVRHRRDISHFSHI